MKKLFVIVSLLGASLFTSCDNENSVNPQPIGKATISGIVTSDLDENDEDGVALERVANVTVSAVTEGASESYAVVSTAQTNANGEFSIEIPVGSRVKVIRLYVADFATEVNNDTGELDDDSNPIYKKVNALYTEGMDEAHELYVVKDLNVVRHLQISQPTITGY